MSENKSIQNNLDLLVDNAPSEEQEAVEQILRTSCFLRHDIEAICEQFNLTKSQYFVLKILNVIQPDALPRCEIIDKMIEPSPDVTRLIDKLQKLGYVKRFRSNEDARMSMNKITNDGKDLLNQVNSAVYTYFQHIGNMLTKDECIHLSGLCKKINSKKLNS
mgnify:FL=1